MDSDQDLIVWSRKEIQKIRAKIKSREKRIHRASREIVELGYMERRLCQALEDMRNSIRVA